MPTLPPSTMMSASDSLPLASWICSSVANTRDSVAGSLASQSFCGARRMRAPLAPPRLSPPRKLEAEAQAVNTSSAGVRPAAAMRARASAMSAALG